MLHVVYVILHMYTMYVCMLHVVYCTVFVSCCSSICMHYVYTQHKYYYYTHAANAAIALYAKCAFNVRDIKLAIARIRHTLSIVDVHYAHYLRTARAC